MMRAGTYGLPLPAVALVVLATGAAARPSVVSGFDRTSPAVAPAGDLTSADECGRCHRDIHRYWKASIHARAADNWRFQDLFTRLRGQVGASVDALCLRCHAPAALHMRDARWEKKVSWEGVTCDVCHSVRSIGAGLNRTLILNVGSVKTGPLRGITPVGHDAQYAEVHTTSAICEPCHQFTNDKRLDVLSTYEEWRRSRYAAQNITCQSCHMRAASGEVVDPKVRRTKDVVNLHEMPGGHSVAELNRALLALLSLKRRGEAVDVTVEVQNRGAGHSLPTGSPLRSIVMRVEVNGGIGQQSSAARTYARVVVDEAGQELGDEGAVWLQGARTLRDTRLAPHEKRIEQFSFPMARNTPVRAVARFFYRYTPGVAGYEEQGQSFLSVNGWLDAEPRVK